VAGFCARCSLRLTIAGSGNFIAPTLQRRKPEGGEAAALTALDDELAATGDDATAEALEG
jgi:lysyl-tRNA synthetase class 1